MSYTFTDLSLTNGSGLIAAGGSLTSVNPATATYTIEGAGRDEHIIFVCHPSGLTANAPDCGGKGTFTIGSGDYHNAISSKTYIVGSGYTFVAGIDGSKYRHENGSVVVSATYWGDLITICY